MLYKDYYRKGSVEKISGRESQGAWRQDELTGDKPPVVKWLGLRFRLRDWFIKEKSIAYSESDCSRTEVSSKRKVIRRRELRTEEVTDT
jgi:hypothetical protein